MAGKLLLVTALVAASASALPQPQQRLGASSRGAHLHVVSDGRVGSIWDWVSNHGRRTAAAAPPQRSRHKATTTRPLTPPNHVRQGCNVRRGRFRVGGGALAMASSDSDLGMGLASTFHHTAIKVMTPPRRPSHHVTILPPSTSHPYYTVLSRHHHLPPHHTTRYLTTLRHHHPTSP